MPEYFIALSAFPLTASGKILKRELVEWAKAGTYRAGAGPLAQPPRRRLSDDDPSDPPSTSSRC